MCLYMTYTPCATSSMGKTGNIITFVQFEEGNLLSELVMIQKEVTNPMTIKLHHH